MKKEVKVICIGIAVGIFAKNFCIDTVKVQGISMESALRNNQTVFVNMLAYGLKSPFFPKRIFTWKRPACGDVVVFRREGNLIVKRICAVEGMPLEYSWDNGYNVSASGSTWRLSREQYEILKKNTSVPEKTVFLVGDNAENSIDSRNYGFVPEENILGRVILYE